MKSIAILLDGGFVRRRLYSLQDNQHASADDILAMCDKVLSDDEDLFRIYYYDCPPYAGKAGNPLLKTTVDFNQTPTSRRMTSLLDSIAHKAHVACRRGQLSFNGWGFNPAISDDLLESTQSSLSDDRSMLQVRIDLPLERLANRGLLDLTRIPDNADRALSLVISKLIRPEMDQKRVDIKIGLDVAWLASRQIVDRIALVTADTDFIPAMKFARREGVQVVLVTLGSRVSADLVEHADEVRETAVGKG